MKYPNVICPNCHRPTLRALWFNKYAMGRCVLTCLSCSWEKDITWRWMLKRRHIKMQQEQGRRERGEDAANPRDGRHQ